MKKKILKLIGLVIVLILAFILIRMVLNYRFYQKLAKVAKDVIATNNYSCNVYQKGTRYDPDTGEMIDNYSKMGMQYKDGKYVQNVYRASEDNYALSGKLYVDDENDKETLFVNFDEKTFSLSANVMTLDFRKRLMNYPVGDIYNWGMVGYTWKEKLSVFGQYMSMLFLMKHYEVTEDGKDYIVLQQMSHVKVYFDKETLLALKEVMIQNGKEIVNEIFEIEVGNVTDEDVNIPDLSSFRQEVW